MRTINDGEFLMKMKLERNEKRSLRRKIQFLKQSHREKFLLKRASILKKRAELLNRFRLNYLPLCMEEDLERYAKYFEEEENKGTNM